MQNLKAENPDSLRSLMLVSTPAMVRWDSLGGREKLGRYLSSRRLSQAKDSSSKDYRGHATHVESNGSSRAIDRRALLSRGFSSKMNTKDTPAISTGNIIRQEQSRKARSIKRVPSKKSRRDLFKQTRQQEATRHLLVVAEAPAKVGVPRMDRYGRQRRCLSLAPKEYDNSLSARHLSVARHHFPVRSREEREGEDLFF